MRRLIQYSWALLLWAILIPQALAAKVTLAWDANVETNLAGYRIYYSSDLNRPPYQGVEANEGASPVEIPLSALADSSAPQFSLTGLPSCVHYWFAATAYDTDGNESDYSVEVEATLVAAPQDVIAAPGLQPGVFSVSWNGLSADDTGSLLEYRVYYDTDSGAPYSGIGATQGAAPITIPANELSVQLTGLAGGTTMYAAVEAVCGDGTTKLSAEVSGQVSAPTCDNGVIEAGETCDPIDSCPTDCNDGNACTADTVLGNPAACTASCDHVSLMNCQAGDGCCPANCHSGNDTDCSASCNNNVVEPGETCDPPSSCPTICNDGISCTNDQLIGSAANCSATCSFNPITNCIDDDGCCPPSCNSANDSDCSSSCGNGVVETDETCDPPGSCPTTCEDGNACTRDMLIGSAANCSVSCSRSIITSCASGDKCCPPGCDSSIDDDCSVTCDNGIIEAGETCDPPSSCPASCDDLVECTIDTMTGSVANCSASCSFTAITACSPNDGCCPPGCTSETDNDCSSTCGDNVLDPGETCDPKVDCPIDCNDGNVCTRGILTGSVATCSAACSYASISECTSGDGCCPPGCSMKQDDDCDPNKIDPDPTKPGKSGSGGHTLVGGCSLTRPVGGDLISGLVLLFGLLLIRRRRGT